MRPQFDKFTASPNSPNGLSREVFAKLRFRGGLPMLIFRNHENGRVKVFRNNEWIATIVPGHLIAGDEQCVLLSHDANDESWYEFRGDSSHVACALSMLQQSDGDWRQVDV